ncbi:probable nucleoside diphosphate kinase 5 isoform X6 [Cicer arietinum]|uniref:Nucleoside diphosphate kinase n=1 Tax=Cicer arietinum TaxID=3827 RepID=A0A3Q7Y2V8_CICAR|nr:probable nucleoside diphosphate kinase 5 isoform X6 [Cicer arietinum]
MNFNLYDYCWFLQFGSIQMRTPFVGFFRILVLLVFVSASCSSINESMKAQKTLAIIKPDGLLEHSSKSFFSSLVKYMTSGPVLVMVLEKDDAIADWRALMGPTDASKAKITHPHSIRAKCGLDTQNNCVHGSDSINSAQREISFFFKELSADIITEHDEL